MDINLIFDAAASANTAAAAAFRSTMEEAASIIDSTFTDNITVNLNIDYSGTGGGAAAGPDNGQFVSYSTVYNYLTGTASPGDSSFDYLPVPGSANAPSEVVVWNAQLKAMGLLSPNSTTTDDGSATFATDINSNLLLGVALHELTHAMGRVPYGAADIMELDRYSSAGSRVYDGNVPASEASYFSLNGGLTKWAQYGVNSDPSDFLNAVNYGGDGTSPLTPNDPFNQYYTGNTLQYLTPVDLEQMDTLGFHLKYDAPAEDAYDFNGSNSGDFLVQNAGGQIMYANMSGGSFRGWVNVGTMPGWTVVGEGKISGNADSNIVIQNNSTGVIDYGEMANGALVQWVKVKTTPGYDVVGIGDINDDHYDDVVIENPTTGLIEYANMNGGVFSGWAGAMTLPGWSVVGVADINYDGYADIVVQNQSTGQIEYANMDNGVFNGLVNVATMPGWNVVGAGDVNGSGFANIVIQKQSTGQIDYANMQGGVFDGWVRVKNTPGWNVIAVEDVNSTGFDDIVIQNSTTDQIEYANMTTGQFQGWSSLTTAPPGFTGATAPAPVGDSAATVGATATTVGTTVTTVGDIATTVGDIATTNVSMLDGGGFLSGDGSTPTPFNTDPGTPLNGASLQPFVTYQDSDDTIPSADGGGFTGPATTPDPGLPRGVWVAIQAANNIAPTDSSTISSAPAGATAATNVSMLDGAGFPSGDSAPTPFNTDPGTPLNGASLQPFVTYQDSDDTIPSSDGGGFTGPATTPHPGLPRGVWVAIQAATATGVSGAANLVTNQNDSLGTALPTSANWLTEGAQNGLTPTNGAAQVTGTGLGGNSTSIVTADNLQNLLHSGSSG